MRTSQRFLVELSKETVYFLNIFEKISQLVETEKVVNML